MELTGEHKIPAPRKVVWDALHDPEILKDCITGCQRLEKVDDDKLSATVQAKVGPVKATFDANVEIVDPVEPERYTLKGEGKGGVAGFAKGSAAVDLAEDGPDATILTYKADAKVGGKLAQLGSRLVDTTAKKYAADFFSCLAEKLSQPAVTPGAVPPEPTPEEAMTEPGVAGAPVPPSAAAQEPDARAAAFEMEEANKTGVAAPRPEDTVDRQLEAASGKRAWGGAWFWGILAFAVVILLLIALV